jgi:hypothetical protein
MTLRDELEPFASTGREAFRIVENLLDAVVAALSRIRQQELELLFADARGEAEQRLFDELRDRVHLDDVDGVDRDER